MATLASVHIKSDLEKRLEEEARYHEISKEELVVSVIETALDEQEQLRAAQDEATMIGVQQMRDGDFMTLEEWETRMENHLRTLKNQSVK